MVDLAALGPFFDGGGGRGGGSLYRTVFVSKSDTVGVLYIIFVRNGEICEISHTVADVWFSFRFVHSMTDF